MSQDLSLDMDTHGLGPRAAPGSESGACQMWSRPQLFPQEGEASPTGMHPKTLSSCLLPGYQVGHHVFCDKVDEVANDEVAGWS